MTGVFDGCRSGRYRRAAPGRLRGTDRTPPCPGVGGDVPGPGHLYKSSWSLTNLCERGVQTKGVRFVSEQSPHCPRPVAAAGLPADVGAFGSHAVCCKVLVASAIDVPGPGP